MVKVAETIAMIVACCFLILGLVGFGKEYSTNGAQLMKVIGTLLILIYMLNDFTKKQISELKKRLDKIESK